MTEEDWVTLGKESVSFTALDCTEAVKKTMLTPAQKCQSGTRFKKTKDGGWVPTISSDLEGIDIFTSGGKNSFLILLIKQE